MRGIYTHTHTILVEKPEGIICETCRREGKIKEALKEMCDDVDWIHLTSTPEAQILYEPD
jgi:hypothetical protein